MKKIEYRERALKILPWVCAKCGRDFPGKKLRELTVRNWELLCIYCHDNEHSRSLDAEWLPAQDPGTEKKPTTTHTPFANLKKLLSEPGENE
jgi:hypothetical protein